MAGDRDQRLIRLFVGGIAAAVLLGVFLAVAANPDALWRMLDPRGLALLVGALLAIASLYRALRRASAGPPGPSRQAPRAPANGSGGGSVLEAALILVVSVVAGLVGRLRPSYRTVKALSARWRTMTVDGLDARVTEVFELAGHVWIVLGGPDATRIPPWQDATKPAEGLPEETCRWIAARHAELGEAFARMGWRKSLPTLYLDAAERIEAAGGFGYFK